MFKDILDQIEEDNCTKFEDKKAIKLQEDCHFYEVLLELLEKWGIVSSSEYEKEGKNVVIYFDEYQIRFFMNTEDIVIIRVYKKKGPKTTFKKIGNFSIFTDFSIEEAREKFVDRLSKIMYICDRRFKEFY